MKTIALSSQPPGLLELLEQARQEDLIVQLTDGSEFFLAAVDDFDREVARTRTNAKLMALLETRAKQTETVPLAEVKRRLGLE